MFQSKTNDVYRIDLMGAPRPDGEMTAVHEESGVMTLQQLRRNYQSIVNARAIYYPVAYHFLRELGRGRQGAVFLGLRQGARGCVTEHAIKVYDPDLYHSAEEYWTDMGRIASQISRLQRVNSPNVVTRHSYEETHGIGYVQMDSIDGMDLRRFLNWEHMSVVRRRCPEKEWRRYLQTIFRKQGSRISLQPGIAVYILRGVLKGLERLHEQSFLHSDVKPGNVMIDRLGNIKIIDFGRAVTIGEECGFLLGSPMYMSPETHRREIGDVRSDLYSAGLMGLEMLSGRPLADLDADEDQLLKMKLELPCTMFDILPAHVLENSILVTILRRLIDPDPARRFQSAKDAEVGDEGLSLIDKQLVQAGLDSEYARDLSEYLTHMIDDRTQRVEPITTERISRD